MADTKISNLPVGTPAQSGDFLPIARGAQNYSLTPTDFFNFGLTTPLAATAQTAAELAAGITPSNYAYLPGNVLRYGADLTGVADSATAIQSAILSFGSGSGTVFFPPGTYKILTPITLVSKIVMSGAGVTINYGGATPPVISATTGVLSNSGWIGGTKFIASSATGVFLIYSAQRCQFDVAFNCASQTVTLFELRTNTTGTVGPSGNHNSTWNAIRTYNFGTCGTHMRLAGGVIGFPATVPTDGFVTDNLFDYTDDGLPSGVYVRGIDFAQWCDSNTFITKPHVSIVGANSVGVEMNSQFPAGNAGVYANVFEGGLSVDAFGSPGGDARIAIKENFSAWTKWGFIEANPVPIGGIKVQNANVYSSDWSANVPTTNYLYKNFFGTYVGIGAGQNSTASLYTSNFVLTGANPVSILCADTFSATATGSAAGVTFQNQTAAAAFVMGTYAAINVTNITKGAGSSVTNQIGIYVPDLISGTNNYALNLNVASGANKFNVYAPGTAANYFAGTTTIGGTTLADNAAAGFVGETILSTVGSGSAVALTTATPANITSISLTAGDWDVTGNACFLPTGTTNVTLLSGGSNSVSATFPGPAVGIAQQIYAPFVPGANSINQPIPTQRFSLGATTTIYLVGQANFTASTMGGFGNITARRRR